MQKDIQNDFSSLHTDVRIGFQDYKKELKPNILSERS